MNRSTTPIAFKTIFQLFNTYRTLTKTIADRYFNELKNGSTVPRNEKTGDVLPFKVGKEYIIRNEITKEEIKARCTQDCPYHLIKII